MPRDPGEDPRGDAERRVRERFASAQKALAAWQREEQKRDSRAQREVLERTAERDARLREEKKHALEQHDRAWQRHREALAHKVRHAPALGMVARPRQAVEREYEDRRRQWLAHREQIARGFDTRIAEVQGERATLRETFRTQNRDREQRQEQARADLARRQQQSFERQVRMEMERREHAMRREFQRQSRTREPGLSR